MDDLRSSSCYIFYQFPSVSATALLFLSLRLSAFAVSFPHLPNVCHSRSTLVGPTKENLSLSFHVLSFIFTSIHSKKRTDLMQFVNMLYQTC